MENHHIWKIEQSHNMTDPGIVVWICATSFPFLNSPQVINKTPTLTDDPLCSICGPSKYVALGGHNETYLLNYNCNKDYNAAAWEYNLNLALSLQPKFVRASPSTIEILNHYSCGQFNCPVITSEESLVPHVRQISDRMFTKTIDKMMCWDGGLGWWECNKGRKHIYDEFCFLENIEDYLVSTDLNNEAMPFFRYHNGDKGEVNQGLCECGLYGNYFETFYGKTIEGIITDDDRFISGISISESFSAFLRGGTMIMGEQIGKFPSTEIVYRIHQKEDKSIHFYYFADELSSKQCSLITEALSWIIFNKKRMPIGIHKTSKEKFFKKENRRTKSLAICSDYLRAEYQRLLLS